MTDSEAGRRTLEVPRDGATSVQMLAYAQGTARVFQAAGDQTVYEGDQYTYTLVEGEPVVPRPGTVAAQVVDDLMVNFQPPPLLDGLITRARRRRWVSLTVRRGGQVDSGPASGQPPGHSSYSAWSLLGPLRGSTSATQCLQVCLKST